MANTLTYLARLEVTNKIQCCVYLPWAVFHNTSFPLKLINEPNKLACYTTLGCTGFQGTNTLAYLADLQVMK
jgi:hypothetical protein